MVVVVVTVVVVGVVVSVPVSVPVGSSAHLDGDGAKDLSLAGKLAGLGEDLLRD